MPRRSPTPDRATMCACTFACALLAACAPPDEAPPDGGVAEFDAGGMVWPRGFDPPSDCGAVLGVPIDALFDADVVRIALLLPESGSAGAVGRQMSQAVELALEELNAIGGLPGERRVGALACDSRTLPDRAFDLASWMLVDFPVPAVIGPGLSASTFLLDSGGLLVGGPTFMSPSATHPDLAGLDDQGRFWRTAPDDGRLGQALGRWFAGQGVERVAVAAPDDRFGDALSAAVSDGLCGGPCPARQVTRVAYDGGSDPLAVVDALRGADPGAIAFLGAPGETRPMLSALADFAGPIGLAESLRDPAVFAGLPPALLARIRGVSHGAPDSPTARRFVEAFRTRWGSEPGAFAAHAYDATWIVAHAIGALPPGTADEGAAVAVRLGRMSRGVTVTAGADDWPVGQAAFRDPAAGTFDFEGASGALDFDDAGQAPGPIEGWGVTPDGRIERLGVWLDADDGWRGP